MLPHTHPYTMKTVSTSFLATFLGWVAAFSVLAAAKYSGGYSWFDDRSFWLFWTSFSTLLAWFVLVLPALASEHVRTALTNRRTSWFWGVVLAFIGFSPLVLAFPNLIWFPAIVGFVAGVSFPLILRRSAAWYINLSIPVFAVLAFTFLAWPLSTKYAAKLVYPLSTPEEQKEMMADAILPKIHEGMRRDELNRLLPEPVEMNTTTMRWTSGTYSYSVRLEDGVVTEVRSERLP